jgi:DNA-binding transcriptional regulator GbsR (MarR family)
MSKHGFLLGTVSQLVKQLEFVSVPIQVKMLGEVQDMFVTMKEYVKYYRCVFAFQVLLAHLDK